MSFYYLEFLYYDMTDMKGTLSEYFKSHMQKLPYKIVHHKFYVCVQTLLMFATVIPLYIG